MTGRRVKLLLIVASLVPAALVLAAWTQTWFTVPLPSTGSVTADGSIAAPALTALALSQLVLLGAIAIAGRFLRVVLGVIQVFLGATVALSAFVALGSPIAAASSAVTKKTGVAGIDSVKQLITGDVTSTAWPYVAAVAGIVLAILGILMVITSPRWPGSPSRKYSRVRLEPAEGERTAVDDWDALTGGEDPTGVDEPTRGEDSGGDVPASR